MEAAFTNNNLSAGPFLKEVVSNFFKTNTLDSAKVVFWKLFQCWAKQDCKEIDDLSDEDVALFFDQLLDLLAAAHLLHHINEASEQNSREGCDD